VLVHPVVVRQPSTPPAVFLLTCLTTSSLLRLIYPMHLIVSVGIQSWQQCRHLYQRFIVSVAQPISIPLFFNIVNEQSHPRKAFISATPWALSLFALLSTTLSSEWPHIRLLRWFYYWRSHSLSSSWRRYYQKCKCSAIGSSLNVIKSEVIYRSGDVSHPQFVGSRQLSIDNATLLGASIFAGQTLNVV